MKVKIPLQAANVIAAAKDSPSKGDYRVYSMYKGRIDSMGLTPAQYEEAIKRLAKALRV